MDVSFNAHNHDDFLDQFPLGSFLQSRFWKRVLELEGHQSWQLSVYDDQKRLVAHAVVYSSRLPLGKSYLYSPKGPLILPTLSPDQQTEALELMLSQARDITIATHAREEIFCRIEPSVPIPNLTGSIITSTPIQPTTTSYLELAGNADDLIATFHEKTRYNIRLAEKRGVTVTWGTSDRDLSIFYRLLKQTARRQHMSVHRKQHYAAILNAGRESNAAALAIAHAGGKPIAANLYVFTDSTMTYLHGGFDYAQRSLMAPFLLQWAAMQEGYKRSARYFDFWGYAPLDGSKPSWAGISRFKAGFGGKIAVSPGCWDIVYNRAWYEVYGKFKMLRRFIPL